MYTDTKAKVTLLMECTLNVRSSAVYHNAEVANFFKTEVGWFKASSYGGLLV